MARRTSKAEIEQQTETVVIWRATRPMTVEEHELTAAKLRIEEAATGLKVMLVPYSCEAVVQDGEK